MHRIFMASPLALHSCTFQQILSFQQPVHLTAKSGYRSIIFLVHSFSLGVYRIH